MTVVDKHSFQLKKSGKPREQAGSGSPTVEEIFDRRVLQKRLMGDRDLVKSVEDTFVNDVIQLLAELKKNLEEGNFTGVQRQAHSIKGAAGNVGAAALQNTAQQMEMAVRDNNTLLAAELLPSLEKRIREIETVINNR